MISTIIFRCYKTMCLTILIFLSGSVVFAQPGSSISGERMADRELRNQFVTVEGSRFMLAGEPFRFVGSNAYYLPNYQKLDPSVVLRAFDLFESSGVEVIRMWAFYDGFDCGYSKSNPNEAVIQTTPGVYNEFALRYLDEVIAIGKQRGIRFILPLINYWDELGGICQYNTWAGAESASQNMRFFLENKKTQKWYRDYIRMLLNRVNTVTGIAYKDEPAIMSWQIMNEGRNPGGDPLILKQFYREIGAFIKEIAPRQLVGTGEEGFDEGTPSAYSVSEYSNTYALRANEGTSYIMNTSLPEIDYGNAHWYPSEFGFGNDGGQKTLTAQRAWLRDHQRIAKSFNKPFVLGEYGFQGWGDDRVLTVYDAFWSEAESIQLDGSLIWQLTADYVKCYEFGGNICWPGGRQDAKLYENFVRHIRQTR